MYNAPVHACESQSTNCGSHLSPTTMWVPEMTFYQVPLSHELSRSHICKFLIEAVLSVLVENFSSVLLAFRYNTLWDLMPNNNAFN